jgi:ATP-dependent protease Clp ATPase subunit
MQILSVAVYNHYKRIYFESLRKGNVKPSNSEGLVLFLEFFYVRVILFFCVFELEHVKELVGASGILSMHAHKI